MTSITRLSVASTLACSTALVAAVYGQGDGTAPSCSVATIQAQAAKGTTITDAKVVAPSGATPQFCQVEGRVTVPGNEVNFRLGLPERWNGKYYFIGVGGLGGTIGNLAPGLARGYASASTDTGHEASDPTWGSNRPKEIDYGHRGTHVTAVAGKELTASFYGRAPQHAYFNGCSNGGRQALMEVQRYPADFDGVIAGHPSTGTPMQAGRALVFQKLLASLDNYLPADKVELLSNATLAACDAADGLEDGLISDPRRCTFRPETLRCKGANAPNCLTSGQIDVVKQIYDGVKTKDGKIYAHGFPVGHEGGPSGWRAWIVGATPPDRQADGTLTFTTNPPAGYRLSEQNFRFLAVDDDDPSFNWRVFRLDRDLPRLKTMTEILSPSDPDLRPFKTQGGKLLLYHGWADPAISAYGTVAYYQEMVKKVGGQTEADSFARLYLVPGMHHCAGGPGPNTFDMLPVLEDWVERGVAPGRVIAAHQTDGRVDRTRPLCPHPQVARYARSGSIDEAANFTCEVPATR
jgi:feruloyl esterase